MLQTPHCPATTELGIGCPEANPQAGLTFHETELRSKFDDLIKVHGGFVGWWAIVPEVPGVLPSVSRVQISPVTEGATEAIEFSFRGIRYSLPFRVIADIKTTLHGDVVFSAFNDPTDRRPHVVLLFPQPPADKILED